MITPKKILHVIHQLEKVLKAYPLAKLDMLEPRVNINYPCGSIHCFAGWYAVATCDLKKPLRWKDGTKKIANDLGFKTERDFINWAEEHPDIWGNYRANIMFANPEAFESTTRSYGAGSIQDIIDHLKEVYQRLKTSKT